MKLDKVKSLPRKVIDNIEGIEGLTVYLVQNYNKKFLVI